jgi:hypothetical protein
MITSHNNNRGIALVLTLSILVIATILVVGFAASMRTERQAATSIANSQNAEILAQAAVDHAISILDQNIPQPRVPQPSPTALPYAEYTKFGGNSVTDVSAVNWATQPGLLTTIARHDLTNSDNIKQIPLSTNPNVNYVSTNDDANVNAPLLNGTANTLTKTNQSMRVAWISIVKDPTVATSATNQIIGRYGFWVDDESTKINVNTAYGKTSAMNFNQLTPGTISVNSATYPLGHPSSVNLDILGSLDRQSLATAVGTRGGLSSIDEIKPFVTSGTPDDFFNTNKFDLTSYGRAPEFNVFGKSKLYFLRKATGQLGYPLFQFFRDRDGPDYFPMEENTPTSTGAAPDRHATYYTAAALAGYFNRTDWPGTAVDPVTGNPMSFVTKWDKDASGNAYSGMAAGDMGKREADQVAWNLLTFGSFAGGDFTGVPINQTSGQYYQLANAATQGETGFVSLNRPNSDVVLGPLSNKMMLPAYPVPLINEICLVITPESYTVAGGATHYRLHASLNVELWLPPGYPPFDFTQSQMTIGMTYLMFHVTQALPGNANSQQEDAKYVDRSAAPNDNGIRKGWIQTNTNPNAGNAPMSAGQYIQLTTALPFYIRNTTGFSDTTTGAEDFTTSGTITCEFRMRMFAMTQSKASSGAYGTKHTTQLIPVWDKHDPATSAAATTWDPSPEPNGVGTTPTYMTPPGDDPNDYVVWNFTLDPASFYSGEVITRSLEVADPRNGGLARAWQPAGSFSDPTKQNVDSMTPTPKINNATVAAGYDTNKLAFVDLTQPGPSSNHPSTGFVSIIPTGMQRGIAGSTPKFQPSGPNPILPDWLLLDLVAPNVVASNYGTMSYMNATAGKVNVNSQLVPNAGQFTTTPRFVPLQALMQNMRPTSTVVGTPPSAGSAVVNAITNHTLAPTGGRSYGATGVYDYDGEICEIEGVADSGANDWDKESIIRNLASSITTKSNVFSVWGVAQTVKKNPANNDPAKQGTFETRSGGATADDTITGEKRFEAIVERYIWPGKEAIPGNGNVPASGGSYNMLSSGKTQPGYAPGYADAAPIWETLDGPDPPTYPIVPTSDLWAQRGQDSFVGSTIEAANNPTRALMKYRVVYFKYLTE